MPKERQRHDEYDFSLVLSDDVELTDDLEDALYGGTCSDATISVRAGRVYLTFSRPAASLKDAVLSAISDFMCAGIAGSVLRVDECNLVTQAEIARKIDRTRQLVHQYIRGDRGPGGFPPPVCDIVEGTPLYYWCEVADWLWQNDMIPEGDLRDAQHIAVINSVLDVHHQRRHDSDLAELVSELIGESARKGKGGKGAPKGKVKSRHKEKTG